jgi:flavin-dependent dehydrogenase
MEAAMSERFDAVIIGGGPAGATAAILLARAGWSVALLERQRFPRPKVCGEYLSATNLPLFDALGVGEVFRDLAGPAVTRVGVVGGGDLVFADLPRPRRGEWGRALARQRLDPWLLEQAKRVGATVIQPASVSEMVREGDEYCCVTETAELRTRIVLAAHGSWDAGRLPTQPARRIRPDDLLAFKAHFADAELPDGLMPLLAFPGGYGGMVRGDGDRVSLSCCIRRSDLANARRPFSGSAGEAVLAHIEEACPGVRRILAGARREGEWLAAGPIRPGVRLPPRHGIFPIGNAAGEAHPVIAEGITMAMQSSWLLCDRLIRWRRHGGATGEVAGIGRDYTVAWRKAFMPRLRTSQALAEWAMRPRVVSATMPLLRCCPGFMTWMARLSGKATGVVAGS